MTKLKKTGIAFLWLHLLAGNILCLAKNTQLQQIDSIKTAIRTETDTTKIIHTYNNLAFLYASIQIDSTFAYIEKATKLAESIDYKKGMAECYTFQAKASGQTGSIKTSIENYYKALDLYMELKDSINIMGTYRGLAYAYSYNTTQTKCLDFNLKALELAGLLNDSASLSVIYNNIATIHKKIDNYDQAIYYFQKTLELDKKGGTLQDKAITHSNLGVLKVEHGRCKEAQINYSELLKLLPNVNNSYLRAYFYISLASYYTCAEKYDSSRYYIQNAIKICDEFDYHHIKARAFRRQGELFYKQGNYSKCINFLDKCIGISNSVGIVEDFPRIFKMKAEAQSLMGQYKQAYLSIQKSNEYNNSQHDETAATLAEFEKEQQAKLEEELNQQQAMNESIKLREKYRLTLVTSILLLLSMVIFIYFYFKSKRKNTILRTQHKTINKQKALLEENITKLQLSEKSLQEVNSTKDKFFSIIAHDLRSPFNAIMNLSNELFESYDEYNNTEQKEMIRLIANSSESTFFLLENLLNWARSQSKTIKINPQIQQLRSLVEESILAYRGGAEAKKINVNVSIHPQIKINGDKETVKVVIGNLFSNAIKFTPENGTISQTVEANDKVAKICIADNGVGMNPKIVEGLFDLDSDTQRPGTAKEKGTGLGLVLCREFIELNKGRIWVESEEGKGSRFYFSLPIS